MLVKKKKAKVITRFRPRIRSRHPSHEGLRTKLSLLPFRSVVRLGSTTHENTPGIVECNTVEAVKNSSSKLLMKQKFEEAGVKTADWGIGEAMFINEEDKCVSFVKEQDYSSINYPVVAKSLFGSRGQGNFKLDSKEQLEAWMRGKDLSNYIFEKFYSYSREYRLHVTKEGCFYTCRKVLKEETPEDKRWFRNDSNSNWILEENPLFDKPVNWQAVIDESVKALNAVGLDFGAIDLKIQSSKKNNGNVRENPEFIVIEINSAPSFGDITEVKYLEEIPKILKAKYALLAQL